MNFPKKTLKDVPLDNKTVLVRVDYNVPLRDDGTIGDDYRIEKSVPTIQALLDRGCTLVLVSHLGRPEGRDELLSLEPTAARLAELLHRDIRFVDRSIGDKVHMAMKRAPKGSVTVLENMRFHSEEEANDEAFAKQLVADTGAAYVVQDAFGAVHRAHATTDAVTHYAPSVAGLLVEREYVALTNAMNHSERPLVAVVGGAKVKDKIEILTTFVEKADTIYIGGAMANTFLAYKGNDMKTSMAETDQTEILDTIYAAAAKKVGHDNVDQFIVLPTDVAVGTELTANSERRCVPVDGLAETDKSFDIGDQSIEQLLAITQNAKTVIWNGTLGVAEYPAYAVGSAALARALAGNPAITSIIGGGDTADFVRGWDEKNGDSFSHVSTGGGASLELMAGRHLPGIESLLDA